MYDAHPPQIQWWPLLLLATSAYLNLDLAVQPCLFHFPRGITFNTTHVFSMMRDKHDLASNFFFFLILGKWYVNFKPNYLKTSQMFPNIFIIQQWNRLNLIPPYLQFTTCLLSLFNRPPYILKGTSNTVYETPFIIFFKGWSNSIKKNMKVNGHQNLILHVWNTDNFIWSSTMYWQRQIILNYWKLKCRCYSFH